ncbi:MAG: ABC transporter substrate-binding protein [Pseudomonadota bacterium]|nr:ABC transporter substrate-binding protein [Pseudomonadota bacterium]
MIHRCRRVVLLLMCFTTAALATAMSPGELIELGVTRLTKQMLTQRAMLELDPEKLYTLVDQELGPHLAVRKIARLVVGRHWKKATQVQQEEFTASFRRLLIKTYAASIFEHVSEAKVEFKPFSIKKNARTAVVRTLIRFDDGSKLPVDYKLLRVSDGRWLIYDVLISRLSLVINFRNSYGRIVESGGFEALLELLR